MSVAVILALSLAVPTGVPAAPGAPVALAALAPILTPADDAPVDEVRVGPADAATRSALRDVVEACLVDRGSLQEFRAFATSPRRIARLAAFDAAWTDALVAMPSSGLDTEARIDRTLLLELLRHAGADDARLSARLAESSDLLPALDELEQLEEQRWIVAPVDPAELAERFDALTKDVRAVIARVRAGHDAAKSGAATERADGSEAEPDATTDADTSPSDAPLAVDAVTALRAARWLDEGRRALRRVYEHHADYEPGFAWWVERPYDALSEALGDLLSLLREEIAGQHGKPDDPLVGDPIGRDALVEGIRHEMLAYTPEELLAIGERELAWCEDELRKASAEMGFGDDWKAALARVKDDHVPPGEQDALVRALADEAIAFVDARDLVTIPELARETWRVDMLDQDAQRVLPFAAYGGQKMLVAYPVREMDQASKLMAMRGNNIPFTRIVTPHELVPGHHLQGFMAQRHATHRQAFSTPFLIEGWALYWEMRLWDLGWARDAADRIGMLVWRAHRAARILVSLRFHLGEMTPDAMIDFLVEHVGFERDGATSEVRRYVGDDYGPLYQCGYMIGGLELCALHDELVGPAGMTERAFHDAVLEQGPIPVEMIRCALRDEGPGDDWRPAWRFAGDP
ncbi:MAG: DUF885 family protein [Planctomycetes bacterium]|nr:DUF885 family protein [Planctomycetota bacterium]